MRTAALAVLAAACAATPFSGAYEAALPASGGGGERHIRVNLHPGGTAAVTTAPSRLLMQGTWRREGNQITLSLGGDRPGRMVFRLAGDQLHAREWDPAVWGEAGPGVLFQVW